MIPDIHDTDFDALVENSKVPVLVEFWQPGCGHCRALLSQLEQVQLSLEDRIHIVKMNVEDNFQIPADLEIQSLPAVALFHRGEFVEFIGGLGTAPLLVDRVSACLQKLDSSMLSPPGLPSLPDLHEDP